MSINSALNVSLNQYLSMPPFFLLKFIKYKNLEFNGQDGPGVLVWKQTNAKWLGKKKNW